MTFAEKLIFLMKITSTSNKQLATIIHVDPSLISLIRTGKRPVPKNTKYIESMASYFAKKCEGNYQRLALSEALERKYLPMQIETEQLSSILFDWLTDSRNEVGQFLKTFEQFSFEEPCSYAPITSQDPFYKKPLNFSYYGNEGKRGAVNAFIDHLQAQREVGTVYLSTDENLEWLFEDAAYHQQLQEKMIQLLKKGFRICYIATPIQSADQGFDTISRWLPLHITGQVDAFFYPRLRDDLYHRTLIILPDTISVISTSIGNQRISRTTLLSLDKRLVNCFVGEFQDFLSKCRPMLTTHSSLEGPESILQCIAQFESDRGNRIQQSTTLSSITLPILLVKTILGSNTSPEFSKIVQTLSHAEEMFQTLLTDYEVIDIHSLATVAEVKNGVVPVGCGYLSNKATTYYTPELYSDHLKQIIYYIETYRNYKPIFRHRDKTNHALMVKEGRHAILLRAGAPLTAFEISQPNIAEACREYLLPFTKAPYSIFSSRHEAITALKNMIKELNE